ncbi:MAG: TIGR03663 family protein [Candidatus Aenigmarchaeota archaeon]|nr:TIGR03663 family protein [Candidatus Aenigmarchaeota archaeon]
MKKELVILLVIFLLGVGLRFYDLERRPVHFDEGGGYADGIKKFYEKGEYHYNPDFHGPFLFYAGALSFKLFGLSDFTLRLMPALFGSLTVLLLYLIRNCFKNKGFLIATILIVISPSLVYYSRFGLHDSYHVFFNLATFCTFFLYQKTKNKLHFFLFIASFALLFTTKENAYIFLGIFGLFLGIELIYSILSKKGNLDKKIRDGLKPIIDWVCKNWKMLGISFVIFIFIFSIFYSAFFKYPEDILESAISPMLHWVDRGVEKGGFYRPYTFYLRILLNYEFVALIGGLLGILLVIKENTQFNRFISIWTILSVAIYLWMPYKLPNNVTHVVLPLCLSAGTLFGYISKNLSNKFRILFHIILGILILINLGISIDLNFNKYENEPENLLAFVQSTNDLKDLVNLMNDLGDKHGRDLSVIVSVPQTEYPLSWYLRDFRQVRYLLQKVENPENWDRYNWGGDAKLVWDSEVSHSGNRSIKISSVNGSNSNWQSKIYLNDGCYILGSWVKTENLEKLNETGEFARILIRADLNDFPSTIIGRSDEILGTRDWEYLETDFCVEDKSQYIWIEPILANWAFAKGTIWYDDFTLNNQEGEDISDKIINRGLEKGFGLENWDSDVIIVSEDSGQTLEGNKGYILSKYTLRPTVELAVYVKEDLV